MKTLVEINNEIKALQRKMNQLFSKRKTQSLSVAMESADTEIEKIGSRIRALQWVINYEEQPLVHNCINGQIEFMLQWRGWIARLTLDKAKDLTKNNRFKL